MLRTYLRQEWKWRRTLTKAYMRRLGRFLIKFLATKKVSKTSIVCKKPKYFKVMWKLKYLLSDRILSNSPNPHRNYTIRYATIRVPEKVKGKVIRLSKY